MTKRKLVLDEHERSVLATVGQEGYDPHWETFEGTLEEVLNNIPKFLGEANEEWAVSPKKPAYVPPVAPKPATTPAAATTPAPQKAEELPLLTGTETGKPAEAPAEEQAPVPTEEQAEEQAEVPTEAKVEVEVAESPVQPSVKGEPIAPAAAELVHELHAPSAAAKPGEWEYYLQDGRGPFESVQAAMDEMGLDKNTRPGHNRWDRLSTALKEKIQRRARRPAYDGS